MDELIVEYRIENVSIVKTRQIGDFNGEKISALVDCLEVEMVPVSGAHSSATLRFSGGDLAVATAKFKAGDIVELPL